MNTELQAKAKNLYFQTTLTKTDIANALGIPRRTLHYWIKEHNWDYEKQCAAHMPVLIAENCYHILANYTQQLMSPERNDVMISLQEVNTIHRLSVAIAKLKSGPTLNENMEMFTHFSAAVNTRSPELAKSIAPFVTNFLSSLAATSATLARQFYTPPTPEEMDAEARLDRQYATEEQTITYEHEYAPTQRPQIMHPGEKQQAAHHRRSQPSYTDLLANLRSQDENIKHMFPVNTRYPLAAA